MGRGDRQERSLSEHHHAREHGEEQPELGGYPWNLDVEGAAQERQTGQN